jgi:hypothetical protein
MAHRPVAADSANTAGSTIVVPLSIQNCCALQRPQKAQKDPAAVRLARAKTAISDPSLLFR